VRYWILLPKKSKNLEKKMRSLKLFLLLSSSMGLLFLGACSNTNQTNTTANSPVSSPSETPQKSEPKSEHPEASQGGQVVEVGAYHLELVTEKENEGTHLDLYLQKGDNHEVIPNAKVTAKIQAPDGSQKELNFKYDADSKHYTILFPDQSTGQYQVKVTANINGENIDSRFSFNQ
jgi:hypothetical protein